MYSTLKAKILTKYSSQIKTKKKNAKIQITPLKFSQFLF